MQNIPCNPASTAPRLRNQRGVATMAVLMLSLGVGATTAVFSVADSVMPRSAPYVSCETAMEFSSGESGVALASLSSGEDLRDRVADAYETSYESAGDAIGAIPDIMDGFGERFILAMFGAAAIAILIACTRGASRLLDSPGATLVAAGTTIGALAIATLSLRALHLPMIGVRTIAFALCISVLAVHFARAAQKKAALLTI
jgi:hypothetical protein